MALTSAPHDANQTGYATAGAAWNDGPMLAYRPLARHLLDRCPVPLPGVCALDAGAGTGGVTELLRGAGAFAVAVDLEPDMLRFARGGDDPMSATVAGDVTALPFPAGSFDVAVAAFVLNHLADPATGVRELARVCRRNGVLLASTFTVERAEAKNIVDDVASRHGWHAPEWYRTFHERARQIGTVSRLIDVAASCGLRSIDVAEDTVDVGLDDAELVCRYRLGMPQFAAFLAGLDPTARARLHRDVVDRLGADMPPCRPSVITLCCRVP